MIFWGACPAGCRLTLPLWCPQGGLPALSPADLATVVSAGGACLPCRLPAPPFACFFAPISPPALAERSSPPGKGEIFSFLMQGASPLASPRLRRRRHGLNLRCRCPLGGLPGWLPADLATVVSAGGLNPNGTCSPCPGGEDHLKRRSSSPPVPPSPWLPALLLGKDFCRFCTEPQAPVRGVPAWQRL